MCTIRALVHVYDIIERVCLSVCVCVCVAVSLCFFVHGCVYGFLCLLVLASVCVRHVL